MPPVEDNMPYLTKPVSGITRMAAGFTSRRSSVRRRSHTPRVQRHRRSRPRPQDCSTCQAAAVSPSSLSVPLSWRPRAWS